MKYLMKLESFTKSETYIKKFEKDQFAFSKDDSIEDQIIDYLNDVTFDEDSYDDCPFKNEIAILHQSEYIDDIYEGMTSNSYYVINVSLEEFNEIYNVLLKIARKKIIEDLVNDPSLYDKWGPLDYESLEIPDWIKNAAKYNL